MLGIIHTLAAASSWSDDAIRVAADIKAAGIAALGAGGVIIIAIAALVSRTLAKILTAVFTAGLVLWAATHLTSISDKTGQQIDPQAAGSITRVVPMPAGLPPLS